MHPSAEKAAIVRKGRHSVRKGRRGHDGRRGGRRTVRIIAELLAFTILVIATALLLRPLQENLLRRMVELRDAAIERAETIIGRQIEYRSMGPSIFGTIDLREIRVIGSDGVALASIARLRIGYSLGDLLSGHVLASIRSVSLDRPVFDIDTSRDNDLITLVSGWSSAPSAEGSPPSFSPLNVRVRGGSVSWKDEKSQLRLSNVSLTAISKNGRIELDTGATMDAVLAGNFARLGAIRTTFRAKGEMADKFDAGNLTLSVPSFRSDIVDFRPQTVLVVLSKKGAEIRKIKGRSPFDVTAIYNFNTKVWTADLSMEGFSPHDLLSLRGPLSDYDVWLDTEASGSASLTLGTSGTASYRLAFKGRLPSIGPLGGAEAEFAAAGDEKKVDIAKASIRSPRGNADFEGHVGFAPIRPEGRLRLSEVQLRNGERLDTDIEISSVGKEITFFADRFAIGDIAFSAVDGRLRPEGDSYTFSVSALRFSETQEYEDVRLAHVATEGSFSTKDPLLQFSVSLDAFSAGEALEVGRAFVHLPAVTESKMLADLSLTTEIFITTDFTHLSYNVPRLVVAYRGGADIFSVASVSGTDSRLDLRDIRVIWKGGSAGGSASIDFHDLSDISFSVQADYRNTTYRLHGLVLDGRTVSLQGDYGLRGTVLIAEDGKLSGFLSLLDLPIPLGERRLAASLSASFRWAGRDSWAIAMDELRLEESAGADSRGFKATARGSIDQDGAVLPLVSIDDGQGPLSGNVRFSWPAGFRSLTATARLADDGGLERYEAEGAVTNEGFTARLYLSRGRLQRFVPNPYDAVATGELRLRWGSMADYEVSWSISEIKAKVQGDELSISGSGTLSPDILDLEDARISYSGFTTDIGSLHIDRPQRTAEASFRIRGTAIGREADIIARGRLSFSPIADWKSVRDASVSVQGTMDVSRARLGTLEAADPFQLTLEKKGAQFSLSGGPNDAIRFTSDGEGAFYAAFAAPSPLRGTLIGTIARGEIDAHANGLYLDFPALWRLLPITQVQFNGGIIIASLSVKGPLGDPEFTGSAHATGVRLEVPNWIEGEAGPATVDVNFTGDSFSFGPVTVPVGKGSGIVTGKFNLDRWIPSSFDLSIEVPPATPIKAKADIAGVVSRGTASGNLRLERHDGEMGVTGLLTAESATIMMDPERFRAGEADAVAPEPYPVHVALGLRTGRKVEFAWPSTDLPVLRVSATAGNSLSINYDGMSGRYALKGDVFLRGGEVFYFQRSFYVREGAIRFNESEVHMDPSLSVRAEIRDRFESGPVTIALIVDDSPLSKFMPRLESDPALSQLEIFSLLGQNLVEVDSKTGSASMQDSLLLASSDILAQFNVIRRFEQNARDLLGLDMFSVRTQVLQNAVLDATGLRSVPVDRIGGLGNYFDNTTVYLGKYIGSDLFLQAMLSLQYEENKAGNVFGGLNLAPDIGIELKTPLFLVRWSFLPEHPENIFMDDMSFTFTWKKSF